MNIEPPYNLIYAVVSLVTIIVVITGLKWFNDWSDQ
jgi:hypothetical protein